MKKITISFVLGTRPEIIKMFPLIKAAQSLNIPFEIIHTGQHFDPVMSQQIWQELKLPPITKQIQLRNVSVVNSIGSAINHIAHYYAENSLVAAEQMGIMINEIAHYYKENPIDNRVVLVQGDTNSTLAGALVANKMGLSLIHVEAGCRSGFKKQPEEINRILVDQMSDLNFAMDLDSMKKLRAEKLTKNAYQLPNTAYAACYYALQLLTRKNADFRYRLMTIHRAENADNPKRLENLYFYAKELSIEKPLLWVLHPRTQQQLKKFSWFKPVMFQKQKNISNGLYFVPPQTYLDFLALLANSDTVLSDSGGIVDETTYLSKPLIVLRRETERMASIRERRSILLSPELSLRTLISKTKKFEIKKYPVLSEKIRREFINSPEKMLTMAVKKLAI